MRTLKLRTAVAVCAATLVAASLFAAKLDRRTLAVVNGHKITDSYLEERFKSLPEAYRGDFANRKDELLEQLIIERLLIQEAQKRGLADGPDSSGGDGSAAMGLIQTLFSEVTASVRVEDAEIRKFYESNKKTLPSQPFERLKEDIREYLLSQKQNEAFNAFALGPCTFAYLAPVLGLVFKTASTDPGYFCASHGVLRGGSHVGHPPRGSALQENRAVPELGVEDEAYRGCEENVRVPHTSRGGVHYFEKKLIPGLSDEVRVRGG
jgi:hypothetical protein